MADQQQLSPADFAAKIKAKYPAYASIPDAELVTKITAKYPQYKSAIATPSTDPLVTGAGMMTPKAPTPTPAGLMRGDPAMDNHQLSGAGLVPGSSATAGVGSQLDDKQRLDLSKQAAILGGMETGGAAAGAGGMLLRAAGSGAGAATGSAIAQKATTGKVDPKETALTGAGIAGGELLLGAGGKLLEKGEPLARLNKILGVGSKEVRVGATPNSLDEFASNPARGVLKAGLEEKQLAKMNPLERTQALTQVRNEAGQKLDQVLQANPDKIINVQKTVEDVFKEIPDRRLQKLATTRLQQILAKANITKPLSQLTPMEARTVQRGLDDFANFAPEGSVKSFSDIATALRRGISKATRQAIKETAELDQDYGDLAGAVKSVRRQANKYARTVPEGKLRKMAPFIASAAGGGAATAAVSKYLLPSQN